MSVVIRELVLKSTERWRHACLLLCAAWGVGLFAPSYIEAQLQPPAPQTSAATPGQGQTGSVVENSVSSQMLILFLERHPEIMLQARQAMAQSMGVDASSINDASVYDRLRQDPALVARILDLLHKKGYDVSSSVDTSTLWQNQNQASQIPPPAVSQQMQAAVPGGPCPAGYVPMANSATAMLGGSAQTPVLAPGSVAPIQSPTGPLQVSSLAPSAPFASQTIVCEPSQAVQAMPIPAPSPAPQSILQQRTPPYSFIPSLQDLYSQNVPPDETTLKRFGSDVFLLGTGNVDAMPMDLPAGPDYVLGSGDAVNVNMWGSQSTTLTTVIDRQGQITLPEAGSIGISGMTIAAAQAAIQRSLQTQFKNQHVEISLGRVRTVRVYVVGDVQRPGAYDISSLSSPLNALFAAGGPTSTGSLRVLRHYRERQLIGEVDLYDFFLHGIHSAVERLQPGDTLLVPPTGEQVTINGMVRRPAVYELRGTESLKDILEMAGGVMVSASLQEIRVDRLEGHERRTAVSVRMARRIQTASAMGPEGRNFGTGPNAAESEPPATGADPADLERLAGFRVQDGDSILVRPMLPYNEGLVYLDGHVFRPGRYPYWDGMTINDLLHDYQEVMPEPADGIELVRLNAPDFRPTTTILNLPDVLAGNSRILLKPFDVIRVFSRYEEDAPRVSIVGDVVRPGDYPMSKGMTVSGLISMAGGFRRSADRSLADLASYTLRDRKQVLLQTTVVDIARAENGDHSADVQLKPGDVLGIREITGWQDIGSSISVSGEVVHPGSYGIMPGERLSSVLKRAGGFRPFADPTGAVLERAAVRALDEKSRGDLIQRIESRDLTLNVFGGVDSAGTAAQSEAETFQLMRAQQQEALAALRSAPASGRLVIKIGEDISKWENTSADIELRADDTLFIPNQNNFVMVAGEVYRPTAISFRPDRTAEWYLRQAGGPTRVANRRDIYILHADGSVLSRGGFLSGSVLNARLLPGDAILVPEKLVGPSVWRNLFNTAQAMVAPAMLGVVATR